VNTLEREVLKQIGENVESPDVFTDDSTGMALVRRSINDAIQEMLMVKGSYKRTYHLPLMNDRPLYRMAWTTDYFGYVVQAWDRERHYRLEQTDLLKLAHIDGYFLKHQGEPTHYYHVGYDVLGIYRKPSYSGKILELDCVCIPKAYIDGTDPISLRKNFERATVAFALSEYYASRGDAKRAAEYFNEYLEVGMLKQLQPETPEQQYRLGGNAPLQGAQ
jgi:hypothetical protein